MNSTLPTADANTADTAPAPSSRRWHIAFAVLAAAGLGLVGCNTTEGAGRDIQSAGEALEDAAD